MKLEDEKVFIQNNEQKNEIDLGSDFINKSDNKTTLSGENVYDPNNEKQLSDLGKTYENNLDDE